MCVHCLIQLLGLILGYFRLALCMLFSSDISEREKKHSDQAQESNDLGYEYPSENQIKGTKYGNSEGFNLSNTKSGYSTDEFQRQSTIKKGNARRPFNRKKHKFLKRNKSLRQKGNILKFDHAHLLRSDHDFSGLNSIISYPLQRRCNSNSASTSSESDEDTERRMEESIIHPEYSREASSSLIASGGPMHCNGSRRFPESHFRDQYINMHPEIQVSGITADYDQQNTEFYTQAASAIQAVLECEEALNCIGCRPGIDHDLIYQDFLSYPETYKSRCIGQLQQMNCDLLDNHNQENNRNRVRYPVPVTDDKSTSESGFAEATGLKVPGTESEHAPMRGHSPFDGGTEISGEKQSSLIRVHDEDQGATGGAPINYEVVRSVRGGTFCIVCKNCIVEVKFKPCGHAVCCYECAIGERKCPACKELILDMAALF